jgi:hypothetical protein
MTYTHLTMTELCWIEQYGELGLPVKTIAQQVIANVTNRL